VSKGSSESERRREASSKEEEEEEEKEESSFLATATTSSSMRADEIPRITLLCRSVSSVGREEGGRGGEGSREGEGEGEEEDEVGGKSASSLSIWVLFLLPAASNGQQRELTSENLLFSPSSSSKSDARIFHHSDDSPSDRIAPRFSAAPPP